jgi:hypothetical protein
MRFKHGFECDRVLGRKKVSERFSLFASPQSATLEFHVLPVTLSISPE